MTNLKLLHYKGFRRSIISASLKSNFNNIPRKVDLADLYLSGWSELLPQLGYSKFFL